MPRNITVYGHMECPPLEDCFRCPAKPWCLMRIAVVHSYYSKGMPSGENAIVDLSVEILRGSGHDVEVFARQTSSSSENALYKLKSGARVATGAGASPSKDLEAFSPDIVHVHNLFPNFSTRWLAQWRPRLIATMHNFRALCANGLLFRNNNVCMECPTGSSLSSLRHACYRDSRVATLPLAIRNFRGLTRDSVFTSSSRVIILSDSARDVFARFGGPIDRMVVLPNGVPSDVHPVPRRRNGRWLVVGRLTAEKGVAQLVKYWPDSYQLDVVGEGPLSEAIRAGSPPSIRMLGQLPRPELLRTMADYEGLIFPSVCLEMQPTTVIEAMSVGLPIVALQGNAGADLVTKFDIGRVYSGIGDLEQCLDGVIRDRDSLAFAGRQAYQNYTPQRWLSSIESLYTRVSEEARRNGAT